MCSSDLLCKQEATGSIPVSSTRCPSGFRGASAPRRPLWTTDWTTLAGIRATFPVVASIHRDRSRKAKQWRVAWRERGRQRSARFATKGEAQRFVGELARGARPAPVAMTVAAWLAEWLETRGPEWEDKTARDRAWFCDKYVVPHLGGYRLNELTRSDVRAWRRDLTRETTDKQANVAVRVLSAALGAAVDDDLLIGNPCNGLRPLTVEQAERRPATIEEVEAIRAEIHDPADRAVVSLMAYLGLRPGEARSVQWRDFADGVLVAKRGERRSGRTKTGRKRDIRLPAVVVEDLEAARLAAGDRATVHRGMDGGNWRNRVWWPACRRAGVEGITPYALRHTAASLWIAEGLPVKEVADRMGHSMKMTMDTYSHLFREDQVRRGERAADAAARARAETEHPHD